MGKLLVLPAILFAALSLSACGSSGTAPASGSSVRRGSVVLSAETIPGIGEVVVEEGQTLYAFIPDQRSAVTCVGPCADAWPPLEVPGGSSPTASAPLREGLVGTATDPEGGRVATYAGWPLYRFVSDTEPGEANGQGVDLNGGYWYVISPAGELIR